MASMEVNHTEKVKTCKRTLWRTSYERKE